MKSMLNTAVAVPAAAPSVHTICASMIAVAIALGAALAVPAVSGMPTGIQATVAVYHHADWGQHSPRQRRIANTRNYGAPNEALMVTAQSETTPAL